MYSTLPLFTSLPGAFAFIVLKEDTAHTERVKEELRSIVASKIAKYAVPDHVLVSVWGLPLQDIRSVTHLTGLILPPVTLLCSSLAEKP